MVSYQYTYLIGDLIILLLWLILFIRRKDTRKEMIILSLLFGILVVFFAPITLNDWWKPQLITNTDIGIEDFLFGFGIGGVAAIIYEHFMRKKIKIKKAGKKREYKRNLNILILLGTAAILQFGLFYGNIINSFYSSLFAMIIPLAIIYVKRPDLIEDSILSGFFILIVSIIGYQILNVITPGFFDEFWLFENIGRKIVFGIPLEEHIFYFLFGALIGPLYEYWQEGKLINIKK